MADIRPFRALRFDGAHIDPALVIAPPYDVISSGQQRELYGRSPHNIVRVEYGEQHAGDGPADNRYTRAAQILAEWRRSGGLLRDPKPALYAYSQQFDWDGRRYTRAAIFAAVRLEEWDKGVIRPHEHTLAAPKADRLELLRATRTQVSPVYGIARGPDAGPRPATFPELGSLLYDFQVDGERHTLRRIDHSETVDELAKTLGACDVYIADGHHRYETALAYRDELRSRATNWTGDAPENFVLMALTRFSDPGLLVLPTHRLVKRGARIENGLERISELFEVTEVPGAMEDIARFDVALRELKDHTEHGAFLALGLLPGTAHLLALKDRRTIEQRMPADRPAAWKRLDVNALQYGILGDVFGIDGAALMAGETVTYTQDAHEALAAVRSGTAAAAFLLNATPLEQVLAVADAGARMPQKSTYFHPKLPTGLVMRSLEP